MDGNMRCRAVYNGAPHLFGAERGYMYTLEIKTHTTSVGDPYIWVEIEGLPDFLLPYESITALLLDWDFTPDAAEFSIERRADLLDKWYDIYLQEGEVVC